MNRGTLKYSIIFVAVSCVLDCYRFKSDIGGKYGHLSWREEDFPPLSLQFSFTSSITRTRSGCHREKSNGSHKKHGKNKTPTIIQATSSIELILQQEQSQSRQTHYTCPQRKLSHIKSSI